MNLFLNGDLLLYRTYEAIVEDMFGEAVNVKVAIIQKKYLQFFTWNIKVACVVDIKFFLRTDFVII